MGKDEWNTAAEKKPFVVFLILKGCKRKKDGDAWGRDDAEIPGEKVESDSSPNVHFNVRR